MFLLGVPLLIISFAIYNIVVFILPGFAWSMEVLRFPLASGGEFAVSAGDLIIAGSILILLVEMLKAARLSRRSVIDHLLSMVLFVGMLIEFLLVRQAASSHLFPAARHQLRRRDGRLRHQRSRRPARYLVLRAR